MSFLDISDMMVAKELGADIVNKTFPENVPHQWYNVFRNAGWTPVSVAPNEATVQAQAEQLANREALAAQIDDMGFEEFCAARAGGWSPGQPLPNAPTD